MDTSAGIAARTNITAPETFPQLREEVQNGSKRAFDQANLDHPEWEEFGWWEEYDDIPGCPEEPDAPKLHALVRRLRENEAKGPFPTILVIPTGALFFNDIWLFSNATITKYLGAQTVIPKFRSLVDELTELLNHVADGSISPDDAALKLKIQPFQEIGEYAKVDFHRGIRQGVPEVIYGAGKAKEHILGIAKAMVNNGQKTILITRLSEEAAEFVKRELPLNYNSMAHVGIIGEMPEVSGKGRILVATGGTSDIPVAEEAALTAEALGNDVLRLYDVGVSGIHRLLSHMDIVMSARVIIAVAGMEGALPSVVGGLVDCPVIAVPTSVGYGAAFGGVAALLSMLNSCASGMSVVNIDNGFGAGYLASMINHMD